MLNILIVDDDEITRFHASQLLLPLGRNRMACCGADAIDRVNECIMKGQKLDLILMDLMMPGIDGLTTVKEIVGIYNQRKVPLEGRPKIVILSSVNERDTQIDALYACGADHYLTKPLDEDALLAALEELGVPLPSGE